MKIPSLENLNSHVWKLAELIHPIPKGMDRLSWINKVLSRYSVDAQTIDGQLLLQDTYLLWQYILTTEQERVDNLIALMEQRELQQKELV